MNNKPHKILENFSSFFNVKNVLDLKNFLYEVKPLDKDRWMIHKLSDVLPKTVCCLSNGMHMIHLL
jgi:hypothetical protein